MELKETKKTRAIYNIYCCFSKLGKNKKSFCLTDSGLVCSAVNHIEERDNGLLPGARDFFSLLKGADCPKKSIPFLADVKDAEIITRDTTEAKTGGYMALHPETWLLTMWNGSTKKVYVLSEGYFEGYSFDIFETMKDLKNYLRKQNRRDWTEKECLECGAIYTESGHVEPGEMGCDRCS